MGKKYTFDITTLVSGDVNANNCNAICFKNNCNNTPPVAIIIVNGMPIYEQQQLILSGHEGEIDTTSYQVSIIPNGGIDLSFIVIRKYYVDDSDESNKPLTQNTY
jgi:hypothetical protein